MSDNLFDILTGGVTLLLISVVGIGIGWVMRVDSFDDSGRCLIVEEMGQVQRDNDYGV